MTSLSECLGPLSALDSGTRRATSAIAHLVNSARTPTTTRSQHGVSRPDTVDPCGGGAPSTCLTAGHHCDRGE
jgi:hypothetical protein